jgi:hypothetical protein
MKKVLFCMALLAALMMVAGTALAGGQHWQPYKIVVGAAETYVWQPFNSRNESVIEQTGASSTAFVTQLNDQNLSWISQSTKNGTDFASVYQDSPCCYLSYTVHDWDHRGHHNRTLNFPLFTEDFFQNSSIITQADGYVQGHHGHGGHNSHHAAFVYQWGDGNYSDILQIGKNDLARVTQSGSFNTSIIFQDGTGPNVATAVQIGDLNYSDIMQDGGVNSASVYQNGFANYSLISQTDGYGCHSQGGVNTAVVTQMGYMNDSVITQAGGGVHSAYVTQANFCFTASLPSCAGAGCH